MKESVRMNTNTKIGGIHHITAITSSASENLGQDLKLPNQYEPMRAEIVNRLPKLDAALKWSSRDLELSEMEASV